MASPERVQVSSPPEVTARVRNTVTCGESCLVTPFDGSYKGAVVYVADTLTGIPCRFELDEELKTLMIYPV